MSSINLILLEKLLTFCENPGEKRGLVECARPFHVIGSGARELFTRSHGAGSFCKKCHCEENILFLLDYIKLNTLINDTEKENMTRRIYKKYFGDDSPLQLNINDTMFYNLQNHMHQKKYKDIFKNVFEHICIIVNTDILPRFKYEVKGSGFEKSSLFF